MDWKDIGKLIAKAGAPLLGGAIGGPAGAKLGAVVASVIGAEEATPDAIAEAMAVNPEAAVELRKAELEHATELRRMAMQERLADLHADSQNKSDINKTMRAEYLAHDTYSGRWRPTFGYVMAFNMAVVSLAAAAAMVLVVLKHPEKIGEVFGAVTALFSVGLAVLGVNIRARSVDKAVMQDKSAGGLLDAIAARISKPSGGANDA